MQIFEFRDEVVGDYREYIESFISIADPLIRQAVDQALQIGLLWRDPLVQINTNFAPGKRIDDLVAEDALLTLQIFPIEQSNFTLAYGPLTARLGELIGRCNAVIHLAGFSYGAEPLQRPSGAPRRSYTQWEYDVARKLGKPVYLFLAAEGCTFDERPTQGEEEEALQRAHRDAIERCGDVSNRPSERQKPERKRSIAKDAMSAAIPPYRERTSVRRCRGFPGGGQRSAACETSGRSGCCRRS